MNIILLEQKLKELGVPDFYYNFTGKGNNDGCLNLVQFNNKWVVYYSERGEKIIYIESDTLEVATEYIYIINMLIWQGLLRKVKCVGRNNIYL